MPKDANAAAWLCDLSDQMKTQQAALIDGIVFRSEVAVKTPLVARPKTWFDCRPHDVYQRAMSIYEARMQTVDGLPELSSLPRAALDIMFDRLAEDYQKAAAAGDGKIIIKQSCCNAPCCSLTNWQWCALSAIRQLIREEGK